VQSTLISAACFATLRQETSGAVHHAANARQPASSSLALAKEDADLLSLSTQATPSGPFVKQLTDRLGRDLSAN